MTRFGIAFKEETMAAKKKAGSKDSAKGYIPKHIVDMSSPENVAMVKELGERARKLQELSDRMILWRRAHGYEQ